jgi:hypothetical protein
MASVPAIQDNQPVAQPSREASHFSLMQRQAALFASSPLIPESLRKGGAQQAMANCYIAMTIADRMGEDRMTVMQNIIIVHGTAGFKAQYMIARANASGVFRDGIDWEITGQGEALAVTAFATLASTGKRVSITVDMKMAKAEGWTSNKKYQTMPEIMLRYRSGTFLVRMYAPQVMLGYQTAEEAEDMSAGMAPVNEPVTAQALLEQAREDDQPEGRDQSQMGETHSANAEEDARADQFIGFLATKVTVIDVNSLGSDWKDEIASWSEENRTRAAEAQADRIAEIKAS